MLKVFEVRAKYRTISNGPGHTLYLAHWYINTVWASISPMYMTSITLPSSDVVHWTYQIFLQCLQSLTIYTDIWYATTFSEFHAGQ